MDTQGLSDLESCRLPRRAGFDVPIKASYGHSWRKRRGKGIGGRVVGKLWESFGADSSFRKWGKESADRLQWICYLLPSGVFSVYSGPSLYN